MSFIDFVRREGEETFAAVAHGARAIAETLDQPPDLFSVQFPDALTVSEHVTELGIEKRFAVVEDTELNLGRERRRPSVPFGSCPRVGVDVLRACHVCFCSVYFKASS